MSSVAPPNSTRMAAFFIALLALVLVVSFVMKLLGLLGLRLVIAWESGFRQVVMEPDSLEAVRAISSGAMQAHLSYSIVSDIQWYVSFQHTLREGNRGAGFLPRLGSFGEVSFYVLQACPQGLTDILHNDVSQGSRVSVG